ncbi:type-F conjugative transfer system pilin assembly protein TraF [Candidatus Protochlamydia amoebophila]|uniref:Type-F conjugative transfer system pilin assembly protein TraF n=1 Tax=Protochlamydia amoebophila (strain UWE25) TaxID=264201 RepID=Q6MB87_PARUW|nr:type-F conjugative transfer system pilin assembly protein TraF [Candidatus Protochlamydia amoebophila]CAF24162.1 unnamed protein product [Candidatus Protochlamydia amoebophila UWE25]
MSFKNNFVRLSLFSLLIGQDLSGGWLNRKAEGWFWYEERQKQIEEEDIKPSPLLPSMEPPPPLTATEQMGLKRQEIEEKLNQAMLNPSEENVQAYMQIQQQWINQSAQFSHIWLKNLLTYPQLDSRLTAGPVTHYGAQVQKQLLREEREGRIHSLVQSFGLFFFYEGSSPISQAFSFVVKAFAKKYDWKVIAISCDGIQIPDFENYPLHSSTLQHLGIEQFPSLYLVEPKQQKMVPIAFGLSSLDQIEENIILQLPPHPRNHP